MFAHTESVYDEYERMSQEAMMFRAAQHAKKLKPTDLFRRPQDEEKQRNKVEEMRARSEDTMRWLSQFEEFRGKEGVISGD